MRAREKKKLLRTSGADVLLSRKKLKKNLEGSEEAHIYLLQATVTLKYLFASLYHFPQEMLNTQTSEF